MISILAFTKLEGSEAIAAYRVLWPLEYLSERRDFGPCHVVAEKGIENIMATGGAGKLLGYDIYIFQRLLAPLEGSFFDILKEQGSKLVFEVDDDLTDRYRDEGYGDWLQPTIDQMDAVTVSTPHLKKAMEPYEKPVYCVPNFLKTDWFSEASLEAERVFEGLVIGLVGGRTHWGDWIAVQEALGKCKQDYPEVTIAVAGYRPPYLENIEDLKFFAPVRLEAYPALCRQFDIILSPLDICDEFNHSKSPVSALETMCAARPVGNKVGGAVAVVSDMKLFRRVVNHNHNGLIVKQPVRTARVANGDWYGAISSLIENRKLREKLQVQGLRWVKKNRSISTGVDCWADAFHKIVGG